ncbi:hypothetical protein LINPERHAP1_LOCUS487, partial [Linum perenne]
GRWSRRRRSRRLSWSVLGRRRRSGRRRRRWRSLAPMWWWLWRRRRRKRGREAAAEMVGKVGRFLPKAFGIVNRRWCDGGATVVGEVGIEFESVLSE